MTFQFFFRIMMISLGIVSLLADSPSRPNHKTPTFYRSSGIGCTSSIIEELVIEERAFNCGEYFFLGVPDDGSIRSWDLAVFTGQLESFATKTPRHTLSGTGAFKDFTQLTWDLPIEQAGSQTSGFLVLKQQGAAPEGTVTITTSDAYDRESFSILLTLPPKELPSSEEKFSAVDIRVLKQEANNQSYTFVAIAFNKELGESSTTQPFSAFDLSDKTFIIQNWKVIGNIAFGSFYGEGSNTVLSINNIVSASGESIDLSSFDRFAGLPFEFKTEP